MALLFLKNKLEIYETRGTMTVLCVFFLHRKRIPMQEKKLPGDVQPAEKNRKERNLNEESFLS